jgi:hypothetical protein
MSSSDNILSELIGEGERLTGYSSSQSSNSQPPSNSSTSQPQTPQKFDEIFVWFALATIIVFVFTRVVCKSWFMKDDEFGEPKFNVKKYVGVSALFSVVVCAGVWYYKKVYVKRGVSFSFE